MEHFFLIILIAVVIIAVEIAIIRYIFRIDTQIRNQHKMINLLSHLLIINGVEQEDVDILTYKKFK